MATTVPDDTGPALAAERDDTDGGHVDVLIPAFNAAATVASAVESIRRQTFSPIVIHVVDDGSTDATPAILAGLAAADPRIRVHRKSNGGIVDALNYGLDFCTGEFVARHDADDIAYPERLAVQVGWLRTHPEAVAVGAAVRHIDADGRPTGSMANLGSPDLADARHVPAIEPYIIHPFLTVRRRALVAVGGYRHVHHAEDTDLYWRLRAHGRLVNLPDLLGDYRMHDQSISSGSTMNGRIMAVSAQLAAVSAQRRAAGRGDIRFTRDQLAQFRAAGSLGGMVELASTGLDASERQWLAEASAAKLLDLAGYRPFELDADDCRFIGAAAGAGHARLGEANRALQGRRLSGTAARLAAAGRWRDAMHLLSPRLLPAFAARYALRTAVPATLRRRLKRNADTAALTK